MICVYWVVVVVYVGAVSLLKQQLRIWWNSSDPDCELHFGPVNGSSLSFIIYYLWQLWYSGSISKGGGGTRELFCGPVIKPAKTNQMLVERWANVSIGGQHWTTIPADTRHWPNAGQMLTHRLRRWANIRPALGQRLVPAGIIFWDSLTFECVPRVCFTWGFGSLHRDTVCLYQKLNKLDMFFQKSICLTTGIILGHVKCDMWH